jgi:hypothetical protein
MPSHRTLDVPKVVPEGLNPRSRRSREESDPSLTDWVRVVGDGWKALAICVGIGLGVGLLATVLQSAQYRATGRSSSPLQFLDPNSADQLPTLPIRSNGSQDDRGFSPRPATTFASPDRNAPNDRRSQARTGWRSTFG